MTKSKWKMLISIFAIFAVMAFAVACGDDDDDTGATNTPGGSAQTTAPSGTITIGATQFETWDPHFSDFAPDIEHFYMVWRGLYEFDFASKPIPSMAEGNPQVSADGKTYTVKLKPGLKWSDGSPLTAKDFVAGLQRTCNFANAGNYQYIMTAVAGCDAYYNPNNSEKTAAEQETLRNAVGVKAVDEQTVQYTLSDAQPTFPIRLAMWPTFPVPTSKVPAVDTKWPGPLENLYNGPFMPKAYTEKSSLELVPNPNWAGKEKPKVEKIILKYVDDAAVLNNAYRNNEVDATVADTGQLDRLKTEFPNELKLYPATRTFGLMYNLKDGAMAKADVRLALSQAVDRVTMNRVVFKEGNTPTTNWMPPGRSNVQLDAYKDLIGYDVAKAKASLSKAGYANGAGFPSLTLLLVDNAARRTLGDFLQAQWKTNLNIDVKLEYADGRTLSGRFNSGDFQLVVGAWQEDYPDPENWFGFWETGNSINKTSASIPALDALIKGARFNQNDEARRKAYVDAEKLLLTTAEGIAPLWHTQANFLVKPHIKGMFESKRPSDTFVPGGWSPEFWSTTRK